MSSFAEQRALERELDPAAVEHDRGNHDLCDPDDCFPAKCAYWRANGGMAVSIPAGWGGPSIRERQKKVISEAVAAGYDPQPEVNRPFSGPVSV